VKQKLFICFVLTLVTAGIYFPVHRYDFVKYDDADYVVDNVHVRAGLTFNSAKWAFSTGHSGNWHPLTWLSHMIDIQLFGLNAGAHHTINVLFHIANALLLFLLLDRMTRELWPSAIVAALFAWHPLHVESVAWIAERKDVLSTFLALLSLGAYARYTESNRQKHPLLSLLCFAAGLTAKPMLVTLPFIFVLLDYWPLKRGSHQFRRLVIEKVPFFLFTAVSSIVTFAAQRNAGAVAPLESVPLRYRLGNALLAYTRYLQKTFLACETGRHLSDFERVLVVANCSRPGAVSRNLDCRCLFVALPGLAFCRLVLVYRHAGPHDWPRSGRHSVDGRSVYLFASRGNFCDVGLDRR